MIYAVGAPVEVWALVAIDAAGNHLSAWHVGREVVADEGATVVVRNTHGVLEGALARFDKRDVRPRFEPGTRVRYRQFAAPTRGSDNEGLQGTVEGRRPLPKIPGAYKYDIRLADGTMVRAWPSEIVA